MIITIVIQLLFGKLVKSNPKLANGLIFWLNWIVGIISNATLGSMLPAPAHAATVGSVTHAVGTTIFLNPIILGFIQSIIATGIHSASKNTWEMFKKTFFIGR